MASGELHSVNAQSPEQTATKDPPQILLAPGSLSWFLFISFVLDTVQSTNRTRLGSVLLLARMIHLIMTMMCAAKSPGLIMQTCHCITYLTLQLKDVWNGGMLVTGKGSCCSLLHTSMFSPSYFWQPQYMSRIVSSLSAPEPLDVATHSHQACSETHVTASCSTMSWESRNVWLRSSGIGGASAWSNSPPGTRLSEAVPWVLLWACTFNRSSALSSFS